MIPKVVDMITLVPSTGEKCIKIVLQVCDQQQLSRVGGLIGEPFACDVQVRVDPSRTDDSSLWMWSGGMRLHQLGPNNTATTKIIEFDSDKFRNDNIAQHLTKAEVTQLLDETRDILDSISEKLIYYKGESESHKEIPAMINDLYSHLGSFMGRKLTPTEITTMTKVKALFLARKILHQRTINNDGRELRAYLASRTPRKYHGARISKNVATRQEIFAIANGLTMTAAVKTARNLYIVEEAYRQLWSQHNKQSKPTQESTGVEEHEQS